MFQNHKNYPYSYVNVRNNQYPQNYGNNMVNQYNYTNVPNYYNNNYPMYREKPPTEVYDYGPNPFAVDLKEYTKQNPYFRRALWTGNFLQVTLMSINVGEDIGVENHPKVDQFIYVEDGQAKAIIGESKDKLNYQTDLYENYCFIIPAGTWHNIINTGNKPLKLFSIYAPIQHPYGTIHPTKADAQAAEMKK